MRHSRAGRRTGLRCGRRAVLPAAVAAALLAFLAPVRGAEKDLAVQGVTNRLEDITVEVEAHYSAMRFNRASGTWNVDVVLTNRGAQSLRAPFVLFVDQATGTAGPLAPDGTDAADGNRPYFDFSNWTPGGQLAPGAVTTRRILSLAKSDSVPRLTCRVFGRMPAAVRALALARALDADGQPLAGVQVAETGPSGPAARTNDTDSALVTLGAGAGEHTWRFEKAGHLPVWRRDSLVLNAIRPLIAPRLTPRSDATVHLTPAAGGIVTDAVGVVRIAFGPGAFGQASDAVLTPLDAQALPALLPRGWSPLQAFWLELTVEPGAPGTCQMTPWDALAAGETAVLARWDAVGFRWVAAAKAVAGGGTSITMPLASGGAYALLVGDTDPALAPPVPNAGDPLPASPAVPPDAALLTGSGLVDPPVRVASASAAQVTATAYVTITNTAGPMPSGLALRADVDEAYALKDGTGRRTPRYDTDFVAYQRPGDALAATLNGHCPIRPRLLLGPEDLAEAVIRIDVRGAASFTGAVFEVSGGEARVNGISILAGQGDMDGTRAVELRSLAPMEFVGLAGAAVPVAAFEVGVEGVAQGRRLVPRVPYMTLESGAYYVLARVVTAPGLSGLEPVERLVLRADGNLVPDPAAGTPRLPGITRAGQYVVVRFQSPLALVDGLARDRNGVTAGGLAARVVGLTWLTFSGGDGRFLLLAPGGRSNLTLEDRATGDEGLGSVTVTNAATPVTVDIRVAPGGPRVIAVNPADGATAVSAVTPVSVTFSRAIDPATLRAADLILVASNGQQVAAGLTLNLRRTVATLLPDSPLEGRMPYTIRLSATVAGATGQPLVGPREFGFRTASELIDRTGAQVVIHEPTNGLVRVVGSAGTADPESPVILVNENSGSTATVLSKPDGSFDNFIEGGVDDFISAVVVNENGTRNSIPASRQLFRDGSVGLYNGGGILEAQSDGGPVRVYIEPGAIESKSKFKLEPFPIHQLLAILSNAPPVGARGLTGFRCTVTGDVVTARPHVDLPMDPAMLDLPPGGHVSNAVCVLTRTRQFGGVPIYEIVDDLEYEDGRLTSHSTVGFMNGEMGSFDVLAMQHGFGDKAKIVGGVYVSGGSRRPVPSAVVMAVRDNQQTAIDGRVNRGALVATSDRFGRFQTIAVMTGEDTSFALLASSLLFPGQYGRGVSLLPKQDPDDPGGGPKVAAGNVFFDPQTVGSLVDAVPPTVSMAHTPALPAVGQTVDLLVHATDNAVAPTVSVTLDSFTPSEAGGDPDAVTLVSTRTEQSQRSTIAHYDIVAADPGRAQLTIAALDGSGFETRAAYSVEFSRAPPPPRWVQNNDLNGPFILWTWPRNRAIEIDPFEPVRVRFSEPIDPAVLTNIANAVKTLPVSSPPFAQFDASGQELTLHFSDLTPDTDYTVTLLGEFKDFAGNSINHDAGLGTHTFTLRFRTRRVIEQRLAVDHGMGVASAPDGEYYYALDRGGLISDASFKVFTTNSAGTWTRVGRCDVPDWPKTLCYIGPYAYRDFSMTIRTGTLVAATGGQIGSKPPWLWIIDVADPTQPRPVASSIVAYSDSLAVSSLRWSPPMLGFLQYGADIYAGSSIGLINLQLFLYAQTAPKNQGLNPFVNEPRGGMPGVDRNGDGDFVDPGDVLPRMDGNRMVAALENGGLVAAYNMPPDYNGNPATEQITDFVLELGGRFAAVTHGPGLDAAAAPPGYRTLAIDGIPLPRTHGFAGFSQTPGRLCVLMGVPVIQTNVVNLLNLALVSFGFDAATGSGPGDRTLKVLNITDPENPVPLADIPLPGDWDRPWSAQLGNDGRIFIWTSSGLAVLSPNLLAQPTPPGGRHPALVGFRRGLGTALRSAVAYASDQYAICQGGAAYASVPVRVGEFAVRSIIGKDVLNTTNLFNETAARTSTAGLLEIVEGPDRPLVTDYNTVHFSADVVPDGTPPDFYPVWQVPTSNGSSRTSMTGPDIDVVVREYGAGPDASVVIPYGLVVQPDEYLIQCERHSVLLRVYPNNVNKHKLSPAFNAGLSNLVSKVARVEELAQTLIPPPVHASFQINAPAAAASLTEELKERQDNHLVGYTCAMKLEMDPLIGMTGQLGAKIMVGPWGVKIYGQAVGKILVTGQVSCDADGTWDYSAGVGGEISLSLNGVLDLEPIVGVAVAAESKIGFTCWPGRTDDGKWALRQCNSEWSALTAKASIMLANGWMETGQEWPLFPTTTLLENEDILLPLQRTEGD